MYTSAQELVMELLHMTPEKYAEHVYVLGVRQIAKLLPGLTSLSDVEDSPEFWSDFKSKWAEADQQFIDDLPIEKMEQFIGARKVSPELYDLWLTYHNDITLQAFPVSVQRIVMNQLSKEHKEAVKRKMNGSNH
jgi:hypothetical protein